MAAAMYIGGRKKSEKDQKKYEVVVNSTTRQVIKLQRKEGEADESGRSDTSGLHRYVCF